MGQIILNRRKCTQNHSSQLETIRILFMQKIFTLIDCHLENELSAYLSILPTAYMLAEKY